MIYIEGAYVPTAEEQDACDMARAMILKCVRRFPFDGCLGCDDVFDHTCPARLYLAKHNQPDAWEVKP